MRESCTPGSVRGVRGNAYPYRDHPNRFLAAYPARSSAFWKAEGPRVSEAGTAPTLPEARAYDRARHSEFVMPSSLTNEL